MIARIFVDTNVFVYARQATEPAKQSVAARWLGRLWEEQTGRTSVQVLNEYYTTLTRKIKPPMPPADAWDDVKSLIAWNPQPMDLELLHRGREIELRHRLSWWDSLIVGAAQLQNCVLLLTEDLQDRSVYGGVTVRDPFTLGVSEDLTSYSAGNLQARPQSHPRRGRPKRSRFDPRHASHARARELQN
jgi:predicted nucleic acid-binding protein